MADRIRPKYRAKVRGYVAAPAGHDFLGAFDALRAIAARFPESAPAAAPVAPLTADDTSDLPCT